MEKVVYKVTVQEAGHILTYAIGTYLTFEEAKQAKKELEQKPFCRKKYLIEKCRYLT